MLRIVRYLKPFAPMLLLAILLLFVQANADLALPDYMSRIVNIGIQQGGIEVPVPEAMRGSTMEHLLLFLPEGQRSAVVESYELVGPGSSRYEGLQRRYLGLAGESVYVLKKADEGRLRELSQVLSRPLLLVLALEELRANPQRGELLFPGLDFSRLPAGADPFAALERLPVAQLEQMLAAVDQRFAALGGERALLQAAAQAVRWEYRALGVDTLAIQNRYILRVGGQMLLITLVAVVATVSVGYLAARVAAGLARELRRLFFAKVMAFSGAELDRFSTASLITRSTNDITQVQMAAMMMVRMLFYAPVIGIGGVIRAIGRAPSMWWIIALAVAVLLGLVASAFAIVQPKFKLFQSLIDRVNRIARENLVGVMVVRAFNREADEQRRFDEANLELTRTALFVNRMFVIMMPLIMLVMNGISALIIWVGAHQVAQANIRVGDMMAFLQYGMQILFAFLMLSMSLIFLPRADVAANRVADVLEVEPSIADPDDPIPFPEPFRPTVEFDHVSFRYEGAEEYVLDDISFRVEAGQVVGIIGTTGSGKSTLVNLIPRFYDPTEGTVYIGGIDIRRVRLQDLRARIGYVPQQSNLFSGTVESNLRYADEDADEEAMRIALVVAQAEDFVLTRPEGLMAEVSQGGINYSGGQRQRLSIARALLKRPPIYIFDDSFSNLDYRTDARLRRALRQYVAGSTVFIISQRVATIKDADLILVLDEGRLIAQGRHEELIQTCPVYREIAASQLKLQGVVA